MLFSQKSFNPEESGYPDYTCVANVCISFVVNITLSRVTCSGYNGIACFGTNVALARKRFVTIVISLRRKMVFVILSKKQAGHWLKTAKMKMEWVNCRFKKEKLVLRSYKCSDNRHKCPTVL